MWLRGPHNFRSLRLLLLATAAEEEDEELLTVADGSFFFPLFFGGWVLGFLFDNLGFGERW